MGDNKLPPLEVLEAAGAWDGAIVDLAGYRARAGRTSYKAEKDRCKHMHVIYNSTERRVWCEDCSSPVDAFDAFMTIAWHFEEMNREARRAILKAREGAEAVIIRRAAKEFDRSWGRKMAPCCPHCRRGLMPHDFDGGARFAVGFEYETALRQKAIDDAKKGPPHGDA